MVIKTPTSGGVAVAELAEKVIDCYCAMLAARQAFQNSIVELETATSGEEDFEFKSRGYKICPIDPEDKSTSLWLYRDLEYFLDD